MKSRNMLSDEQIRSFRTRGYCVAHAQVQTEAVERVAATVWELSPTSFDPDNPKTWTGLFKDCCKTQTVQDRKGRVKFRECLRGQQWVYDLTAGNADIVAAVADLIGDPLPPEYVRGLYPVFPIRRGNADGHCDRHKFQVGVVLYLSDVLPHGGGFTVWPASHGIMARHHASLGGEDRLPSFDQALAEVQAQIRPFEASGPAGTVVFWHHRLVHTAGVNTRKTVRHASLCDFKNEQILAAADRPSADMWSTWSPRVTQFSSASAAV
jgi:hypothetical protein